MFVLKPSLATFDALVDVVREGDFTYERGWRGAGLANGTARQYKNHASETTQGLFYYWFVQRRADSELFRVPVVYRRYTTGHEPASMKQQK